MRKWAYYNEFEKYPAEMLRRLIAKGMIPDGEVDERDIRDVTPEELMGFSQCHFFAGIGGWPYALRLAGWPDDRPVWTGSCPCQSFSSAGKGAGGADERHLWPAWFHLIRVCHPAVIFGEQVASKLALSWLDLVFDDLETTGYACGAADLPACSIGAPHIRNRLWFVGYSKGFRPTGTMHDKEFCLPPVAGTSPTIILGHASNPRCEGDGLQPLYRGGEGRKPDSCSPGPSPTGELADTDKERENRINRSMGNKKTEEIKSRNKSSSAISDCNSRDNFWSSCEWLPCRDGKWRPTGTAKPSIPALVDGLPPGLAGLAGWPMPTVEDYKQDGPVVLGRVGTTAMKTCDQRLRNFAVNSSSNNNIIQPLATGVKQRVQKLKAIGNSIVAPLAAEFIKAFMEVSHDKP